MEKRFFKAFIEFDDGKKRDLSIVAHSKDEVLEYVTGKKWIYYEDGIVKYRNPVSIEVKEAKTVNRYGCF